ncbi:MAG: class F sortase [Acidimicrobiia bacterium]|nr:class F sortase [Acidimicrobiia bacterium]
MTPKVAHGAILLAISLATVGAVASASDWQPPPLEADPGEVIQSELLASPEPVLTGRAFDVPIRSGRLADDVVPDAAVQPVSIRVAGIALEAPVISVGVDSNNQFAVPAADTVGWYRFSSSPGQPGASVLAAHVDYGGVPGAFFNLADMLPGDTLEVEMADGGVLLYEVTGNTEYDKTELPASELFRKDGDSVLQLITCGGTFNPEQRSYNANVVVTAVPITA